MSKISKFLGISLFVTFLVLQLIVPNSTAIIKQFNQDIDVKVANNTLYISAEGLNYQKQFSVSSDVVADFNDNPSFSWYENISCEGEINLAPINDKLAVIDSNLIKYDDFFSDYVNYYDKYQSCHTNLTACTSSEGVANDARVRANTCETKLDIIRGDFTEMQADYRYANKTLYDTKEDLESSNGWNFLAWGIALICAIGWIYVYTKYKKPYGRRGENPSNKDSRKIPGLKG